MNATSKAVLAFLDLLNQNLRVAAKEKRQLTLREFCKTIDDSPLKDHIKGVKLSGTTKVKYRYECPDCGKPKTHPGRCRVCYRA